MNNKNAKCHSTTTPSWCHDDNEPIKSKRFDYLFWGSLIAVAALFLLSILFADHTHNNWLTIMAHTTHEMIYAMWWGIVIGVLMVGLLGQLPREFIMSLLGQGGNFKGLIRSCAAGLLFDLCSHGILMVAMKLYERGASNGQVIAFMLASPWNSFSLTLVLIGLIGLKWTLAFILLSLVIALISGYLFDYLTAKKILAKNPHQLANKEAISFREGFAHLQKSLNFDRKLVKDIILNGIKDSKMVVRWLLFGILLAAILRAVLDPATFQQYFGATILGLMATVFVATVLEVCSEGSTPIAADMVNRAKAPGNGFAFLMAGVASDYTEIAVLKDRTKSLKLALFLPLLALPQVILLAAIINYFS